MGGIGRTRLFSLMTSCFGWLKRCQAPTRKVTLLMVGLDNAGKSSTAKGIQGGECPEDVAPTVGFSRIDVRQGKFDVTIFDVGGGQKIRGIWKNYYAESHGVIFVVDSSDEQRMEEARETMADVLSNPRISGKPILLLANKQDKVGALPEAIIIERLSLERLVNEQKCLCRIEPCSAVLGSGKKIDKSIKKGLSWLLYTIANDFNDLNERVQTDTVVQRVYEEIEKQERAERVKKLRKEREQAEKDHATENPAFGRNYDSDGDSDQFVVSPFQPINVVIAESEKKRQMVDKDRNRILLKPSTEQEQSETQSRMSCSSQNSTGYEFADTYKTVALTHLVEKEIDADRQSSECYDSDRSRKKNKKFRFRRRYRVAPLPQGDSDPQIGTSPQCPLPYEKSLPPVTIHHKPTSDSDEFAS